MSKLEKGELVVVGLDNEGSELLSCYADSMKNAKITAKQYIGHEEYLQAGLNKIEVRNDTNECVWDLFV
jgi:hypothetical protein